MSDAAEQPNVAVPRTALAASPGDFVGIDAEGRMVLYTEENRPTTQLLGFLESIDSNGIALIRTQGAYAPSEYKVTFTLTQEPPQPAPEPYRSLDADARTRTAEWQESVRKRFERRVGAALTSTSLEGLP